MTATIIVIIVAVFLAIAVAVLTPGFVGLSKCGSFTQAYTGCLRPSTNVTCVMPNTDKCYTKSSNKQCLEAGGIVSSFNSGCIDNRQCIIS